MQAGIWVVIPTYNEAENIEAVLRTTSAELDRLAPGQYRILVVDDSSPDGTGRLAEALGHELDAVRVLHRDGKTGLGHAYLAGFAEALAGGAELVVEMDAISPTTRGIWVTCSRPPGRRTWCSALATSPAGGSRTGA